MTFELPPVCSPTEKAAADDCQQHLTILEGE